MSEAIIRYEAPAMARHEDPAPVYAATLAEAEFETLARLADRIADTEFVPTSLRKRSAAILACVLAGREIGIGPMQSLQKINIIQGRPSMSAELMRALVIRAGHRIWTEELQDDRVTVATLRRGEAENMVQRVTWTAKDAATAGLASKEGGMHKKFPRQMLLARATSELCRMVYPDVLSGFSYTPEELEELPPVLAPAPAITPEPYEPMKPARRGPDPLKAEMKPSQTDPHRGGGKIGSVIRPPLDPVTGEIVEPPLTLQAATERFVTVARAAGLTDEQQRYHTRNHCTAPKEQKTLRAQQFAELADWIEAGEVTAEGTARAMTPATTEAPATEAEYTDPFPEPAETA